MHAPNSRTRSKIALNPSKVVSTSLPSGLLPQLLLTNALLVITLNAGKEYLLARHVGVFWVLVRVLACGGFGVVISEAWYGRLRKRFHSLEWTVVGAASLLLFVQQACLLIALYRLSAIRVIMFTHFAVFWVKAIVNRASAIQAITTTLALILSFVFDAEFSTMNMKAVFPGYAALLLHGLASVVLEHTQGVLAPSLGADLATAVSAIGATLFALPLYTFRTVLFEVTETPTIPLLSFLPITVMAFTLLFLIPITHSSTRSVASPASHFSISYISTMVAAAIISPLAFSQLPSWSDLGIACVLFYGMYPKDSVTLGGPPRTPTSRLIQSYLKTILSNPESRKIFYFLMLNLSYMLVQMLYGVWTNSLGLISDAIHMAFDCMAIGMGLLASVMATWPPNERFTYGYGRIETLSGFANGIFLILISIFIVFEAIERILDPPEMNTNQLLLVSSLGLGVNLFGMFAMGGHHHHGHSHSHGHSHDDHSHDGHSHAGHSHSHSHSPEPVLNGLGFVHQPHDHDNHGHSHDHTHNNIHNHGPDHPRDHDNNGHMHDHPHSHDDPHNHDHSHSPPHSHGHVHHDHRRTHSHIQFPSQNHTISLQVSSPISRSSSLNESHFHPQARPHVHSRSQSFSHTSAPPSTNHLNNGHRHGPSLHIPAPNSPELPFNDGSGSLHPHAQDLLVNPRMHDLLSPSPLTPSYSFEHDDHFDMHHSEHVPNLHNRAQHHHHHEGHSHNMRGVFLHVMADTLGSVGVIISTLLIQFYGWTGFDPIASLFIAVLIAASVIPLVIDSGKVLGLDVGDREESIKFALEELSTIDGLASYNFPRFWPKDSVGLVGSIHIQLAESPSTFDPSDPHSSSQKVWTSVDKVVERVDTLLRSKISGLEELTIQVEGLNT